MIKRFIFTIAILFSALISTNYSLADTLMNEDINTTQLENFDELLTGIPVDIEKNMTALLPAAEKRDDKSSPTT